MGAPDVLAQVAAVGVKLTALPDGRIWAEPAARLTDELRALIRQYRAELWAVIPAAAPGGPALASRQQAHPAMEGSSYNVETDQPETLNDPAVEVRRQRVLQLLADNRTATYAAVTDMHADPETVIVAVAIRGRATCEIHIPRDKYDGTLLLDLLERHGGTVQ